MAAAYARTGGIRRWDWLFLAVIGVAFLAFAVSGAFATGAPSISSDQSTYETGGTVALSGSGWTAGETVHVTVDDAAGDAWSHEADVTAADDGTVTDSLTLPEAPGDYSVSATAPSGSASAAFAVAAPAPPPPTTPTDPPTTPTDPPATTTTTTTTTTSSPTPPPPPTIASDQDDYNPGATVTLTGANWQPGESVHIFVNDDVGQTWSRNADVTADTDGHVTDQFQLPNYFVANYRVTATAASGTATTTFTDSRNIDSATLNGGSSVTVSPSASITAVVQVTTDNAGGNQNWRSTGWRIATTGPGTVTCVNHTDHDGSNTYTETFTVTAPAVAGTYNAYFIAYSNDTCSNQPSATKTLSNAVTVSGDSTAPTTTASGTNADTSTYTSDTWTNQNVNVGLSATDNAGGSGVKSITYSGSGAQTISSTTVNAATANVPLVNTQGTTTVSFHATDNANNVESPDKTFVVKIDKAAPSIVASATKADATAYTSGTWTNQTVTVHYVCSDPLSGIAGSCPADVVVSGSTSAAGQNVSASVSDNAGNSATSNTVNVKVDKTPPTISASATKADATTYTSGTWTNQAVTVHFTCSDTPSGLAGSCPADVVVNANTPVAGQNVSASVSDNAGNSATSNTINVQVDKTDPTITASATKADSSPYTPGSWTNQTVTVHFTCSDALSGVLAGSCPADAVIAADTPAAGQNAFGSVSDNAGNSATSTTINVKVDKTAPDATATPDRDPDHNGWYNHSFTVHYAGNDHSGSGISSCTADQPYSGPETVAGLLSGSCTDNAGNSTLPGFSFKYDDSAPSASLAVTAGTSGANGWYTSDVTVSTSGTDATSTPVTCTADQFQTTETAGAAFAGSCTNDAGLSTSAAPLTVKLDKSGPSVALAVTAGTAGTNGWYTSDVTVSTSGSDSISAPVTCTADQFQTAETSGSPFNGSCTNKAGLTSNAATLTVKLDKSKPSAAVAVTVGTAGANGWYTSDVTVSTSGTDSISEPTICTGDQFQTDETTGAEFNGSCTNDAGLTNDAAPLTVKLDKTAPSATLEVTAGTLGSNGWYTSNVTVSTSGSDTVSSPVDCTADQFLTDETTGTDFNGSCTNDAGLTRDAAKVTIKLDKTAPAITDLGPTTNANGAGWYNHDVTNRFKAEDGTSGLDAACLTSFPADGGDRVQAQTTAGEGTNVHVTSDSCSDEAGNSAAGKQSADFKIDQTDPVISDLGATTAPNGAGWYNHNVTNRFKAEDALSGLDAACAAAFPLSAGDHLQDQVASDEGAAVHVTSDGCSDVAGNSVAGKQSADFQIDKTKPELSDLGVHSGAEGNDGWYVSAVVNRFHATDSLSGLSTACQLAFPSGDRDVSTGSSEGSAVKVSSGACTDVAGNTAASIDSAPFKVDLTAPSITDAGVHSGTPGSNGWYVSAVVNRFHATDGTSGLNAACQLAFPSGDRDVSTGSSEGSAVKVSSGACTDVAGNTAASIDSAAFKVDLTDPIVTITAPSAGTSTIALAAQVKGTSGDTPSGISTVTVNGASTDNAASWTTSNTANLNCGANTLSALATDKAGRTKTASITVTRLCFGLQYLQPIDQTTSTPVVNAGKYGRVIPVKVIVSGPGGAVTEAYLAANGLTLQIGVNGASCSGGNATDDIEAYADAGQSSGGTNLFRLASSSDNSWIYNLDTKAPPGVSMVINSCYRLDVYLSDGATKVKISTATYALFKPTK